MTELAHRGWNVPPRARRNRPSISSRRRRDPADTKDDVEQMLDLMLYGSDCLVLFYGAAGGYSYTRIGRLVSTGGLADALGSGDATVTFESFR